MPSATSLFLSCFCCRKLLLEIFSELDGNLREFFLCQDEARRQSAAQGAPHRPGRPPATPRTHPCPRWVPLAPSDAYKFTLTLKTWGTVIFFHELHLKPPSSRDLIRGDSEANPGTLPEGRLIPEGSTSPCLPLGRCVTA